MKNLTKLKNEPGVYRILNLINKKVYYGSTSKLLRRHGEHKKELKNKTHFNSHLQNAWNKYGEENFIFEVVCSCSTVENARKLEQKCLDIYKPWVKENGYNKSKEVDKIPILTKEQRRKISERMIKNNPMKNKETVKKV